MILSGKVGCELPRWMAVNWSDLDFVRHTLVCGIDSGDGAVSVFACACERYRCISPTAQRLVDLIGLIRNHSLHWRPERRYYLGVLKILRKRAIQVKEG